MLKSDIAVLVMDDDRLSRNELIVELTKLGYTQTIEAQDVNTALEYLNSGWIKVVFCSWDFRGALGLAFLKLVKQQVKFKNLKFYMTSRLEADRKKQVLTAAKFGVDGFLLKPILAEHIEGVLKV